MSKGKLQEYQKKIQVNNTYGVSRVKVMKKKLTFESIKTSTRHKKVKRQIDYKK